MLGRTEVFCACERWTRAAFWQNSDAKDEAVKPVDLVLSSLARPESSNESRRACGKLEIASQTGYTQAQAGEWVE
jgi:hypothetical protein